MMFKSSARLEDMTRSALIDYAYELEAKLEALNPDANAEAISHLTRAFRLTGKEAAMLVTLSDGRPHSKDSILTLMYGGMDEPMVKIVDVFVCKIRKKIVGSGIEIGTLWGRGYVVEDTAPLLAVMRGEPPQRSQSSPAPSVGRPMRGEALPHGSVRDSALTFLRGRAVDGVSRFHTKDLEIAIQHRTPGSTMVRNLEKSGYLKVRSVPKRRSSTPATTEWVVKLAA